MAHGASLTAKSEDGRTPLEMARAKGHDGSGGGPGGLRASSDPTRAMRRRNFTVGEANALLPHLREVLGGIQELRQMVGECTDQIKILEVIWGKGVQEAGNPDHVEFEGHRKSIGGAVGEIERLIREEILGVGDPLPSRGPGARPPGLSHPAGRSVGLSVLAPG